MSNFLRIKRVGIDAMIYLPIQFILKTWPGASNQTPATWIARLLRGFATIELYRKAFEKENSCVIILNNFLAF